MIRLIYFSWVRERIGTGSETLALEVPAVLAEIVERVRGLSEAHRAALSDMGRIRAAVNQEFVGLEALVQPGDEVALFPPVTGGR